MPTETEGLRQELEAAQQALKEARADQRRAERDIEIIRGIVRYAFNTLISASDESRLKAREELIAVYNDTRGGGHRLILEKADELVQQLQAVTVALGNVEGVAADETLIRLYLQSMHLLKTIETEPGEYTSDFDWGLVPDKKGESDNAKTS